MRCFDSLSALFRCVLFLSLGLAPIIRVGVLDGFGKQTRDLTILYGRFRNPPREYSMTPLLILTDKIERGELQWQLEAMARVGIQGFFLHPTSAMTQEYLSEEFWEVVGWAWQMAHQLGFECWVYDEVDWPSAAMGGKLAKDHPGYRYHYIKRWQTDVKGDGSNKRLTVPGYDIIAVVAYQKRNGTVITESAHHLTRFLHQSSFREPGDYVTWDFPEGTWTIDCYYIETNKGIRTQYYTDVFNKEAIDLLIERTHAEYQRRFPHYRIHGVFTDEPHFIANRFLPDASREEVLPWTPRLFERFKAWKGYDLVDALPFLYEDGGPLTWKVRADFWSVVSRLFEEAFFENVSRWCRQNHWEFTGHLIADEHPFLGWTGNGGSPLALLRHMTRPGIDWIFPYSEERPGGWISIVTPKLAASVSHFYSRRRTAAELYSGVGLGTSFEEMKRVVDYACALGINHVIPITFQYSLRIPPLDFSMGMTYQEPWWDQFGSFSQYVSRLSFLLSQGHHQSRTAILYPTSHVSAHFREKSYLAEYDLWFSQLCQAVYEAGYDFDLLDEESLRQMRVEGGELVFDSRRYAALLLPAIDILPRDLLEKAALLKEAGGTVIAADRIPSASTEAGAGDQIIARLAQRIFNEPGAGLGAVVTTASGFSAIQRILTERVERPIRIEGETSGVYYQHRIVDGTSLLFLANQTDAARALQVSSSGNKMPSLWDPETGRRWRLSRVAQSTKGVQAEVTLRPYQSIFMVFDGDPPAQHNPLDAQWAESIVLEGNWTFVAEPTMTNPHVRWNFTDRSWALEPPAEFLQPRPFELGLWADRGLASYSGKGRYETTFQVPAQWKGKTIILDLGDVYMSAEVFVNGQPAGIRPWRPYRFDISSIVRLGENRLRIVVANTLAHYYSNNPALLDSARPVHLGRILPHRLKSGLVGPVRIGVAK